MNKKPVRDLNGTYSTVSSFALLIGWLLLKWSNIKNLMYMDSGEKVYFDIYVLGKILNP